MVKVDEPQVVEWTGRRRAFRIVAGILGVVGLALSLPFTIGSFFDDEQTIHRMHNMAFAALYGTLLAIPFLVAARRPERNVSAFLVAVASGVAGTIAGLASGDFISGIWFTAPISIVILWTLHPSRRKLARPEGVDVPTLVVSLLALVPAIAFLLTQAELQRNGLTGDEHWELHHYSGIGATPLALALCGVAASIRTTGRELGAWFVGISGLIVGVGSLVLSDHVGALDPLWAWLTIAFGVAVIALTRVPLRPGAVPRR